MFEVKKEQKIIYDVDMAVDVKNFVSSINVTYKDNRLREKILSSTDDSLLRVGKVIPSLKIISADVLDDNFLPVKYLK